jgi:hypothetical protein
MLISQDKKDERPLFLLTFNQAGNIITISKTYAGKADKILIHIIFRAKYYFCSYGIMPDWSADKAKGWI